MRDARLTPIAALTGALLLALATIAPSQEVILPLHELLYEPEEREPYLEIVRCERLVGSRRFAGESYLGGVPLNEDFNRLHDLGGSGYFRQHHLTSLLQKLGLPDTVQIWNRSLVVPEQVAATAKAVLADLRAALPPRIQVTVRLTQKTKDGVRTRLARSVTIEPGRLHVLSDVMQTTAVLDYQVEIAQGAMIANPIPADVRLGTMVAVRAQLAPSGQWALLETIARCVDGDPNEKIPTAHPGLGPLDRLPVEIAESGRVVLVRPGSKTVHNWSNATHNYALHLETQWQLPPPTRVGGQDFAAFSMRGDAGGFRSVPVPQNADSERRTDSERDEPWADLGEIAGADAQWVDGHDDDDAGNTERYVAVGRAVWAIGATVMRWFESKTAGPEITVTCYDAPVGAEWNANGPAPADARAIGSTRLTQIDDSWSATAIRREYSVIRDWDCEVAQSARIPDPNCERVGAGLILNVRRLGDRFELDGEVSRIVDAGQKELKLSTPVFAPEIHNVGSSGQGSVWQNDSPAVGLIADVVLVEHPRISRARIRWRQALAPGDAALWRGSANGVLPAGRELVAIIQRAR